LTVKDWWCKSETWILADSTYFGFRFDLAGGLLANSADGRIFPGVISRA